MVAETGGDFGGIGRGISTGRGALRARRAAGNALGPERSGYSPVVGLGRAENARNELFLFPAGELAAASERGETRVGISIAAPFATGKADREFARPAVAGTPLGTTRAGVSQLTRDEMVGALAGRTAPARSTIAAHGIFRERKEPEQG